MNLTTLATIAALALLPLSYAQAQTNPVRMRISIAVAQNSIQGTAIETFAKEVESRTNGRYKIMIFSGGALGGEREATEAVQLGSQELTFTSTGPIPNFVPGVRILDIPFLFNDSAHARAVLDGPIGQDLLAQFERRGFKALAWGENGFRHMTNNKRPVNSPDDLKGLKIRTMENPIHIQAYRGFGLMPTPMAFPELYGALQQGVVDGQESPLPIITSSRFDQVQKHVTLTGHVYSPCVFLMNKAIFDKLAPEDQKIFIAAAQEGARANRARVDEEEKTAVAELRSKGVQVVDSVDKAKFQAALGSVYERFEKEFGKSELDRIRNFK